MYCGPKKLAIFFLPSFFIALMIPSFFSRTPVPADPVRGSRVRGSGRDDCFWLFFFAFIGSLPYSGSPQEQLLQILNINISKTHGLVCFATFLSREIFTSPTIFLKSSSSAITVFRNWLHNSKANPGKVRCPGLPSNRLWQTASLRPRPWVRFFFRIERHTKQCAFFSCCIWNKYKCHTYFLRIGSFINRNIFPHISLYHQQMVFIMVQKTFSFSSSQRFFYYSQI